MEELTPRSLTDIINNETFYYALYTVEQRAIPNMMDGFKPVQRFVVYRALMMAKAFTPKKYHKLASVAGGTSELGYHHTETSAQDSGALLANTWNNNFPLLDGQGNFGSRIIQEAAASRYIYARVSKNFYDTYSDFDIAPSHKDLEHIPPKFFLPIIPTVLLNGVKGIATGYATDILPHSVKSVINCTKLALENKLTDDIEPEVSFPDFRGDIVKTDKNQYMLYGKYTLKGKKLVITEVPYKWDREKYVSKVLEKLKALGYISYEDDCDSNGLGFTVTLKPTYELPKNETARNNQIIKDFGLSESVSQNLVVIDETGKLNLSFETSNDLIKHFVKVRIPYIKQRIDNKIKECKEKHDIANAKVIFIKGIVSGDIVISNKSRKDVLVEIKKVDALKDYADTLIAMNIYHMTTDEIKKLEAAQKQLAAEIKKWESTTPEIEYMNDLNKIEY